MGTNFYELTNPQKSIWYTEQFYQGTSINNICGTLIIKEKVDFNKLKTAIYEFIKQNDSFSINLTYDDKGKIKQIFTDFYPFEIDMINLKNNEELISLEEEMVSTPFNLLNCNLFNFKLYKFPDQTGGIVLNFHHLIGDACTANLAANQIMSIYISLLKNKEIPILSTSYINYINSENEYLSSPKFEKDKEYWNNIFDTIPEIGYIPSSLQENNNLCKASRKNFIFNKDLVEKINEFCSNNKISIFNFFMAIYATYISKISTLDNFVLGTPILNRSTFIEKNTSGMFVSTVPFHFKIEKQQLFIDFVKKISLDTLGMLRHQKYPYQNILEDIRKKNPTQPNLYNILISYQITKVNKDNFEVPHEIRWTFNHNTSDALDIHLFDLNDTGNLSVSYDYQIQKFSEDDITCLHSRILSMINTILTNEKISINDIEIITSEEKNYILGTLNNTNYEYDKNLTLIDLFEEQVKLTPNNTAICFNNISYSYLQLKQLVDTIATKIADKNIFSKNIAVIANKSIKTVASFLAIMKSGNCYIPIDPTYPEDRINYIIENSHCDIAICEKCFSNSFSDCIILDDIEPNPNVSFKSLANPDLLAYMIYTSGSTGNPKGVKIKHKNIINTLLWRKNYYSFNSSIKVLQIPSFSFDSSIEDIYTPLISGSTLVIPNFSKMDINSICDYIEKYNINHFLVVPSLYKILLSEKYDYLKNFSFITIAGEGFSQSLVKEHFEKLPNVRLINEYGPTENSVCSSYYEFSKENTEVYIGIPINNCKCFVLNSNKDLLPPNTPGELYLTGIGLSEGYYNRDDLTYEKFIKNSNLAPILYKTGDIVKYDLSNGLQFIGRNDSQIKLNGFRIELQEISNIILKDSLIKDCICTLKQLPNGKDILVAYIITLPNFNLNNLYVKLKESLPYYMIPEVVTLDEYPITPNGKINIKALPIPTKNSLVKHKQPSSYLQKEILEVCKEVLNYKDLYVDDDLFTVALADSLNILTISSRLFAKGLKIPTQYFYNYPTIEKLTNNLNDIIEENTDTSSIPNLKYITNVNNYNFDNLDFKYSNIMLTGATGFLGIHILYYLLINTKANISCIIRRKDLNVSPYDRLKKHFINYFGDKYLELLNSRVTVLEGELSYKNFKLTDENYSSLKKCDCVIHAAAITKHYGDFEKFYNSNVLATKYIVDFCKENNIILNYMSTTSISGNSLVETPTNTYLTENNFYIGQNYKDNVYINSKFKSEEIIYKEQYNGLNANVFRLGNLMGRYSDGVFQTNKYENAFYMKLLTLCKLGLIPNQLKNLELDFSPIDSTSLCILNLLSIPNLKNCIFHITNPNTLKLSKLVDILSEFNLHFKYTNSDNFISQLSENADLMNFFISDLSNSNFLNISESTNVKTDITNDFLEKLNFSWPIIDREYLYNFFNKTNFFNDLNNNNLQ